MRHAEYDRELEEVNQRLMDEAERATYQAKHDRYTISLIPRLLGDLLVLSGTLLYGKEPSYLKFRAVEVVARVPYQSWESVVFLLQTLFYTNETRALRLAKMAAFGRVAQDNEAMHVVVISQLAKREERIHVFRDTIAPLTFALFYYLASYGLFLVKSRWSFELNYCFEQHAYDQYSRFLEHHKDALQTRRVDSTYLDWYGRTPKNQYEFFLQIRNDELIHRNQSIAAIEQEHA